MFSYKRAQIIIPSPYSIHSAASVCTRPVNKGLIWADVVHVLVLLPLNTFHNMLMLFYEVTYLEKLTQTRFMFQFLIVIRWWSFTLEALFSGTQNISRGNKFAPIIIMTRQTWSSFCTITSCRYELNISHSILVMYYNNYKHNKLDGLTKKSIWRLDESRVYLIPPHLTNFVLIFFVLILTPQIMPFPHRLF